MTQENLALPESEIISPPPKQKRKNTRKAAALLGAAFTSLNESPAIGTNTKFTDLAWPAIHLFHVTLVEAARETEVPIDTLKAWVENRILRTQAVMINGESELVVALDELHSACHQHHPHKEARRIHRIPICDIGPKPIAVRLSQDEDIGDLENIILEEQHSQPILVFETEPEKYAMLDGRRRMEAARRCGHDYIDAYVIRGTPKSAIRLAAMANLTPQKPLSNIEKSRLLRSLVLQEPDLHDIIKNRTISHRRLAVILRFGHATISSFAQELNGEKTKSSPLGISKSPSTESEDTPSDADEQPQDSGPVSSEGLDPVCDRLVSTLEEKCASAAKDPKMLNRAGNAELVAALALLLVARRRGDPGFAKADHVRRGALKANPPDWLADEIRLGSH
jgi:ParB/RepB/Spo0J family partition protein